MQRPLDHERDDSMTYMMTSIPPFIPLGQQNYHKLQGVKSPSFDTLMENEHNNMFDGMLSNDVINSGSSLSQLASSSSKGQIPVKRSLPSLFWNEDGIGGSSTSTKRFLEENNDENGSVARTDENSSIASLLISQLPQTPQMHQQAMLGSIGDGVFRQPYQLPDMNWYS